MFGTVVALRWVCPPVERTDNVLPSERRITAGPSQHQQFRQSRGISSTTSKRPVHCRVAVDQQHEPRQALSQFETHLVLPCTDHSSMRLEHCGRQHNKLWAVLPISRLYLQSTFTLPWLFLWPHVEFSMYRLCLLYTSRCV